MWVHQYETSTCLGREWWWLEDNVLLPAVFMFNIWSYLRGQQEVVPGMNETLYYALSKQSCVYSLCHHQGHPKNNSIIGKTQSSSKFNISNNTNTDRRTVAAGSACRCKLFSTCVGYLLALPSPGISYGGSWCCPPFHWQPPPHRPVHTLSWRAHRRTPQTPLPSWHTCWTNRSRTSETDNTFCKSFGIKF